MTRVISVHTCIFSSCSCIDTLIEVLSLSGNESSSELAVELIVLALNDPTYYYFNNILQLEAVKNLQSENELVYKVS